MSESQFNYLFTLKNAHLSSNTYNFWIRPIIAMKFAGYVAWILLWKRCKFGERNYYNSRDIDFFPMGLLFLARPVVSSDALKLFCATIFSAIDHLSHVVRVLLVVVVIHFMTDRQRSTAAIRHGRRNKTYCYPSNVRWTASAAAALLSVYCDSSNHRMTSCSCPSPGNERNISSLFQRLFQMTVSVRRRHKVINSHISLSCWGWRFKTPIGPPHYHSTPSSGVKCFEFP